MSKKLDIHLNRGRTTGCGRRLGEMIIPNREYWNGSHKLQVTEYDVLVTCKACIKSMRQREFQYE